MVEKSEREIIETGKEKVLDRDGLKVSIQNNRSASLEFWTKNVSREGVNVCIRTTRKKRAKKS